ncbi:Hypothetical protein DHA2_7207 [Giardia duodenalis]|uniref:EF-hand domain-containing protein n=1 Tax=Giardia intestinalis TaxID=5741 RepID=V6TCK6_GIAIN|nr:Hypothetical protein DHA2_7207 [Giardia intestinalis]
MQQQQDPLVRIKTIMYTRRPRILEFLQDFDKLRRGFVSVDQFFRALESMGLIFTDSERYYLEQKYATATCPREICYQDVVDELETPLLDPSLAPKGSLAGTTAVYSTLVVPDLELDHLTPEEDRQCRELLEQLRHWVHCRPIIGKLFYQDFDLHKTGLVTANQFMRGTSNMWEALIRKFPTKKQLELLAKAFKAKRLVEFPTTTQTETEDVRKEFSDSHKSVETICDYRIFVSAINADEGDLMLDAKATSRLFDKGFAKYFDGTGRPDFVGNTGLKRVLDAWLKFRPDFKTFLLARDTMNRGTLPYRDFCSALASAVTDSGRSNVEFVDIEEAAKQFLVSDPLNTSDPEGLPVNYRSFLAAIQNVTLDAPSKSTMSEAINTFVSNAGHHFDKTNTANLPVPREKAFTFNSKPIDYDLVRKLQAYLHAHPAPLLQHFSVFDKRHTGVITSHQFKQALSGIVSITPESYTPSCIPVDTKVRTSPFIRKNNGLTDAELEKLAEMFASSTVSGRGTVEQPPSAPAVLAKGGLYVNYNNFIDFISNRCDDIIPDREAVKRPHDINDYLLPHPDDVVYKIANSLQVRNLKIADFLALGEFGDALRSKSIIGCVNLRNIQRSLSYSLDITLTDAEMLSLGYAFPNPVDETKTLAYMYPASLVEHDVTNPSTQATYSTPYPSRILRKNLDLDRITNSIDHAELCTGKLVADIQKAFDAWKPTRMTGTSYKVKPSLDSTARTDPAAVNDIFNNVSASNKQYDNIGDCSEFRNLNDNERVTIKGQWFSIGDLKRFSLQVKNGEVDLQTTCQGTMSFSQAVSSVTSDNNERLFMLVQRASPIILSIYIDFHQRAGRPLDAFREFDKLRTGFVSKDNFARAFVIANMEKITDAYPLSFKFLMELYTCVDSSSIYLGMVDYAFFLRDLSLPPDSSIFLSPEEAIELKRLKYGEQERPKKEDYATVKKEFANAANKQKYDASLQGILEQLGEVCRNYRPQVRSYFVNFDKGRMGICEMSKLGSALTFMHANLNQSQVATLQDYYKTDRVGFTSGFRWKDFVTDLESVLQYRL